MSIYKLVADNPTDSMFDTIYFYEADDANGTNATKLTALYDAEGVAIASGDVPVATSSANLQNPGTTSAYYRSGDSTKYYASTWFSSSQSIETDKSDYIKGGWDRWDKLFTDWLNDAAETVFSSTKRGIFKRAVLEALKTSPAITHPVIDTSVATDSDKKVYTIPYGFVEITTVATSTNGSQDDTDYKIWSGWDVEGNQLILPSLPTDAIKFRIVGTQEYLSPDEVPARYDGLVLTMLRALAYESMADDYPTFEKFAQLQKHSQVTFPQLRLEARQLREQFMRDKVDLATLTPSIDKMRGQS